MLEQQIENGAPADVFVSAAPGPMDKLAAAGLIDPATRRDLLRNYIVLIAPKDSPQPATFQDLATPGVKLIALGDPASVPAGEYGRQVLENMNLLDAVRRKLVLAKDVGQVFSTWKPAMPMRESCMPPTRANRSQVRVAAVAPEVSHQPVVYPAAVIKASAARRQGARFLEFWPERRRAASSPLTDSSYPASPRPRPDARRSVAAVDFAAHLHSRHRAGVRSGHCGGPPGERLSRPRPRPAGWRADPAAGAASHGGGILSAAALRAAKLDRTCSGRRPASPSRFPGPPP